MKTVYPQQTVIPPLTQFAPQSFQLLLYPPFLKKKSIYCNWSSVHQMLMLVTRIPHSFFDRGCSYLEQ